MSQPAEQPGLLIGIDWVDQKHDCYVIDRNGKGFHRELSHSAEDIDVWVSQMLTLADGKPIAIMLEQARGPLVYSLMFPAPNSPAQSRTFLVQIHHATEFANSVKADQILTCLAMVEVSNHLCW